MPGPDLTAPVSKHTLGGRLRTFLPLGIGLAALAVLVLGSDPRVRLRDRPFRGRPIPAIVTFAAGVLVLQSFRWHFLLRELGIPMRARVRAAQRGRRGDHPDPPLGDLTRAIFVTEAKDANFGQVSATVTVQDLSYTLMLVLAAVPAVLQLQQSQAIVIVTVLAVVGIMAVLTVPQLFQVVHAVVARTPVLAAS